MNKLELNKSSVFQSEKQRGVHKTSFGTLGYFSRKALHNKTVNEDTLGFLETDSALFLAVSDGVGSLKNSDQASKTAVRKALNTLAKEKSLSQAMASANKAVNTLEGENGCTLSLLRIQRRVLSASSIGDSPIRRWAECGTKIFSSISQTPSGYWEEMKDTLKEKLNEFPNILLDCLGHEQISHFSYPQEPHKKGDLTIVASDGFFDNFTDKEVSSFCEKFQDMEELVDNLVEEIEKKSNDANYIDDDCSFICLRS